jgi:protocatechuate 3,4-dioxygenase beta subunit
MPSGGAGPSESGAAGAGGGGAGGGSTTFDSTGEALLNTSHASSLTGLSVNATSSTLFGDDTTCLLQPEATIGPYWVAGEYVRYDDSESQPGIPLYLSTRVIDVGSCSPVSGLYWEIWHANSSGVYSGVVASGNGDDTDASNINNTFLRGLQPTDEDGVVAQKTVFPGHYTGRTTHIHVVGHANATVYANGTIGTGSTGDGDSVALHIGQLFFDQDLLSAVAAVSPYSENTQTTTTNAEDSILAGEAVEGASDPFFEYVYLGDDISDGVYAWVTVGITTNTTYETKAASYLTSDGGVANSAEDTLDGGMASGGTTGNSSTGTTGSAVSGSTAIGDNAAASTASSSAAVTISSSAASTASSNAASRNLPTLAARVGGLINFMLN